MSNVRTQINRITGEVTAQASLISQIATALEGKAGGGGSSAELKSASGTAKGGGSTTFTVTGLAFTPSILLITTPIDDSYGQIEAAMGTADLAYAIGWYVQSISSMVGYASAGTFTPTDGGCTLSLTSVTNANIKFNASATYTWYAYGV